MTYVSIIYDADNSRLSIISDGVRCEINGQAITEWQYYPAWMDCDARDNATTPRAQLWACYDGGYIKVRLTDNALPADPRTMRHLTLHEALQVLAAMDNKEAN